mmetsp:Transcript_816/g.1812  ORF Transcript_816/g.1812 Transcript_816/m.1812 type:complete len:891 (+) Transcript_816:14-2686(+)
MASRRDEENELPDVPDEDEEEARSENESVGEDLFGENMMDDYRPDPNLDRYDPDLIDDGENEVLTIEQRMAAERAMDQRDGRGHRRSRHEATSPAFSLMASSLGDGSDVESAATPGARRVRRRTDLDNTPARTEPSSEGGGQDDLDEDIPEVYYNLTDEKLDPDKKSEKIDGRLDTKVRLNFQQFLRKFCQQDDSEPLYPDLIRKMAEEGHMHLDVNFNHLQKWSSKLALWIADEPMRFLPILNETLLKEAAKNFETYRDMMNSTDEMELRVAIHSFPIIDKIRDLGTKAMNKLVSVHGVVTKRNNVFNELKLLLLRCAKCNAPAGPFPVASDKDFKPGACIQCDSRGPWRVDREKTLYRNYQKINLQESPGEVEPGKMPRSKEVILSGTQADSVRPGDEVYLTGVYRCLYDAPTNARTGFPVYRTEIESVHVRRKGDIKESQITDEQQQQILDLAKDPNIRERLIASIAPSIYGMTYVKTAIALSMMGGQRKLAAGKHRIRGDINTLIVGDPGLAKSQFLKYVEQTFPKAVYTTGKGASAVGLTAALTRDENGEWALEGGAMVLADDGICLIDEFDKMNDQDRTSIHEAMEQQSISISKAGIVATLHARCAVIAVANPMEGRYDPQQTFAQNVGLSDPILSRFDMLCVLRDEADAVQDERLADHVVCSHIRSHPDATANDKKAKPKLQQQASHIEPIPQDLLQKYIIYARQRIHPKIMELDKEKLANFYKDIRKEAFRSGGAPMTARHVESIVRMAEANARLELRQHVTSKDLDNAIAMMLESFIQSQKYQIAEELRKHFSRYVASTRPMADQIMSVLDKMFKDKLEMMRLSRPNSLPPEVGAVPIEVADVIRSIEAADIDMEETHTFMRSDRFRQNFRLEGERIFRMV